VLAADLQYALQSANPKGSPIQLYNYFDPDAADSLLLAPLSNFLKQDCNW